jgi:uncharacterized membrane protein required for colicin V production
MSGFIIDGILLIIVTVCIVNGSKKGFARTVIHLAGYIIAVGAASFISQSGSEYIYDSYIKPKVMSEIEAKIDEAEYDIKEKLSQTFENKGINIKESDLDLIISGKMPNINENSVLTKEQINDTLSNVLSEYYDLIVGSLLDAFYYRIGKDFDGSINSDSKGLNTEDALTAFIKGKQKTAEYLEARIIRPVIIRTIKLALFAVVFALAMFAVNIILRMTWIVKRIPVIGKADRFLGGFLGFLQGMAIIVIAAAFAVIIIKLSNDSLKYLNSDVISQTYLFSYIYSIISKISV